MSGKIFSFDGNRENSYLFQDQLDTMLQDQPQITELMKANQFPARLRKYASNTCNKIQSTSGKTLGDVLVVLKIGHTVATAKHW